jgi:hypothetical protein
MTALVKAISKFLLTFSLSKAHISGLRRETISKLLSGNETKKKMRPFIQTGPKSDCAGEDLQRNAAVFG